MRNTPLHIAAWDENYAKVAALLKKGVDIAAQNANGDTALHGAAERKSVSLAGLLLVHADSREIDIRSIKNNWKEAPIDFCSDQGSEKTEIYALLTIDPKVREKLLKECAWEKDLEKYGTAASR